MPVKTYLLFYVVREDEGAVYVIRFLYAKRAWQNILREYVKKEPAAKSHKFLSNSLHTKFAKTGLVGAP